MKKLCKYKCGKEIEFRGKEGNKSTGFFEVDTDKEHTYARCKKLLTEQRKEVPFN